VCVTYTYVYISSVVIMLLPIAVRISPAYLQHSVTLFVFKMFIILLSSRFCENASPDISPVEKLCYCVKNSFGLFTVLHRFFILFPYFVMLLFNIVNFVFFCFDHKILCYDGCSYTCYLYQTALVSHGYYLKYHLYLLLDLRHFLH
jgi:hypothetical protein